MVMQVREIIVRYCKFVGIIALLVLSSPKLWADDQAFVSLDPIPFFESGYHVHTGIDLSVMRYSVMTSESDRPLYTSKPAAGATATSKAVGLDIDYVGKKSEGFYGGPSFVRVRWVFNHPAAARKVRRDGDLIGLKLGYRYYFKPWFFVDGRISNYFNSGSKRDVKIAGTDNKISERYVFPFVEFGVSF